MLYPSAWRTRYGDEIDALLANSNRPLLDGVDVAAHAALVWMEVTMVRTALLLIAAVTLVLFGYVVGQLEGGFSELAMHWWSTAATIAAAFASSAAMIAVRRPAVD